MAQKRRKYGVVLGALVLVAAVAAAGVVYLYTTPIDLSRYSDNLSARVEAKTGVRFNVERILLRALPSVEVTFENIDFFEDSETFLIVEKITAAFSPLKLLTGNFEPRILEVVGPDILVKRYSDGSPNLGARFLANIRPTGTLKKLRLHNGRSTIVDEAVGNGTQRFALTDLEILFDKGSGTAFTSTLTANLDSTPVKITSTGRYEDRRLRFDGSATFGTIDLALFTPYIKKSSPDADLSGSAATELNFTFDRRLVIEGALKYNGLSFTASRLFRKKIDSDMGTARLNIAIDAREVRAGLDGIEFKMADFDLSGGIELQRPHDANAKGRTFRLKLASTPIGLKRFKELLPENLITGPLGKKVRGLKPLGGTVTVEELSVDGRIDDLNNIGALARDGKIGLMLRLDNLKFTGRALKETFSGIKGVVTLEPDKLMLKGFSGSYGHGVLKELNAEITGLAAEPEYALSAKAFFEAGKTLEVLKAVLRSQGSGKAEKLAGVEASGITELDLNLKGGIKDLTPTEYSGSVRLKNGSFGHKRFLLKLSNLYGEVAFDSDKLTLKELRGEAWESVFKASGTVTGYRLRSPLFDITAEGELATETVEALSGESALQGLRFGTKVPFNLRVKGDTKLLNSRASVDFTGSDLKYKAFIDKSAGYPFAIDIDLVKVEDDKLSEIRLKEFRISTGTSRAGITGVYNLNKGAYTLTAGTSELRLSDIAAITPALNSAHSTRGSIGLSFKAVRNSSGAAPVYKGVATITNAAFTSPYMPSPVERLDMTAEYGPEGRLLDIKRFVTGRTDITGKVELTPVPGITGKGKKRLWDIGFDLDATGLFLSDLLYKKRQRSGTDNNADSKDNGMKREETEAGKFSIKSIHSGKGRLRIARGSVYGFSFEEFGAEISIDPQKILSKEVLFKKNRGSVASSITYFRTDDSPLLFDSTSVISGVDLKQFIEELGAGKTIIEGEISAELSLHGKRGIEPATAGLTGSATMKVGQGKLWKFITMSKFLSIINIFSIDELLQQGMPYKRITGDFDITEGVVRSNNIYLESDTLRMTAMGEISVPDQYIDSVLMLHPFVTIDKIVTKIPLAGWIIGGKEKASASMYYEIVGPLKKPYIDPVPEKSISTGVKEMMERLEQQLGGNGRNSGTNKQTK